MSTVLTPPPSASAPAPGPGRLLSLAPGPDLAAHRRTHGPLPAVDGLLAELERSGLTGRGGAGFPTARKIAALTARPQVVVANAAEGEPLSAKDAALLRHAPHLVLDGLRLLGELVQPRTPLRLMVPAQGEEFVRRALAEREDAGRFRIHRAEPRFVAGEATAVAAALHGRPQRPADPRGHLTDARTAGGPVLVQNVETLAHLAVIASRGAEVFREAGTAEDPGTRLVTPSRPGRLLPVQEVPGGSTVAEVLSRCGLEVRDTPAVLVGGFHGEWVTPERYGDRLGPRTGPGTVAAGAGVLLALRRGDCPLAVTAEILDVLAGESAGQCGPCVLGLPRVSAEMHALREGRGDARRMRRRLDAVVGRGACHHPDGTARLAASALAAFGEDVAAHREGRCTGGVR